MVAMARAQESERPDRLFDDPYAAAFLTAATGVFHLDMATFAEHVIGDTAPDNAEQISALLEASWSQVAIRTRFFDEYLLAAAAQGMRQVVLLAAGLDTRAYRLHWPAGSRMFELDLPEMVDFKRGVLTEHGVQARCEHHAVAVDLRQEWAGKLAGAGLRADLPTAWLVEGLLPYLTAEEAAGLLSTVGGLSAAGSRVSFEVSPLVDVWGHVRKTPLMTEFTSLLKGGLPDPAGWLAEHGWETEVHERTAAGDWYGRPISGFVKGFVTATRT
jgi:methyltransferase (TIGR00027 family)